MGDPNWRRSSSRRVQRILLSAQPMVPIGELNGAVRVSRDGRSAYAIKGNSLRRIAQLEDGQVVEYRKLSKSEIKARKRARRNGEGTP